MVKKLEHRRTPSCLLRAAGAVAQPVPHGAGGAARFRDTGLAEVYRLGGHPAGSALQSRSPRCRHRQQPLPPPQPNHPSDTHAAASQHVGRGRCWNLGGRLGTNTDRARHKGKSTGARRGRSARTQTVEAEAATTVVPPEAREEGLWEASPDTLCATGSLSPPSPLPYRVPGVALALPPPAPGGTASPGGPQLPPAAVLARARASRPFMGTVARRAHAPTVPENPEYALAPGCGARLGMQWVGGRARVDRLHRLSTSGGFQTLSQLCLGTKECWLLLKELSLLFLKGARTGLERKRNKVWGRE